MSRSPSTSSKMLVGDFIVSISSPLVALTIGMPLGMNSSKRSATDRKNWVGTTLTIRSISIMNDASSSKPWLLEPRS